jgi:hypothetical protein
MPLEIATGARPDDSGVEQNLRDVQARRNAMRCRPFVLGSLAGLIGSLSLVGCATSRGIVAAPVLSSANPAGGPAVKLVRVTDVRKFEIAPREPSTPSLQGGEIHDPAITARAIARKRNGYGKALGDILLEPGASAADLAASALKKGFRDAGFRVLASGDPGFEEAAPVEAEVEKLWMWFSPGFWAIHLEFEALVHLKGPLPPLASGAAVEGYARVGAQAATEKQWMQTLQVGLEDLAANVAHTLRGEPTPAAHAPPSP